MYSEPFLLHLITQSEYCQNIHNQAWRDLKCPHDGLSRYSHKINLLIRVHQHDFPHLFRVTQNDFKSNVNNNKLEGKKDFFKYRFQYSDTQRF